MYIQVCYKADAVFTCITCFNALFSQFSKYGSRRFNGIKQHNIGFNRDHITHPR